MVYRAFLQTLNHKYQDQFPFVAYKKPGEHALQALIQNDKAVHKVQDFSESGFVIAPFDDKSPSFILPNACCDLLSTQISDKDTFEFRKEKPENPSESKPFHIDLVQKAIHAISGKQFNKVVLSRVEAFPLMDSNPINLLDRLLQAYPDAFVYCWFHPNVGLWLGATPETLLKIKGKHFETMALAGTQLYKGSLAVSWSHKELEEQQIVTDSINNNLKPIAERVIVSETETVRAGNLVHLKTSISGELETGSPTSSLRSLIRCLHPTPAVCGFPKENAKTFILENENHKREFYTGFLGELNMQGASNLYVNLRCMQLKFQEALVYVGGGITVHSNPEQEWQETVNKSLTMKMILH